MTGTEIINRLRFDYRPARVQEDLFTEHHVRYGCYIRDTDETLYEFPYQCNPTFSHPNIKDCLYSLLLDANAYESSLDLADFLVEFGYTSDRKSLRMGIKAYENCKKISEALKIFFSEEEMEALKEYYENY